MRASLAVLALLLSLAGPASAQAIATSAGPDSVSVTVYRDPDRGSAQRIDLDFPEGYALVTETRTIAIPVGEAAIRFEGVAGGIVPESAIVVGLPDGVTEKNQDAYLLSPASLLDRSLGKRVTLRRTSPETGVVREETAIVRTGANGAVIVQTAAGFEALRCSGLPETIVYDGVPTGLSARPTLSVTTVSRVAVRATVTLSYLATGFDWQANYVGTLRPDGREMELFAWVTLANGDETSFRDAGTQAVAGRLNRERMQRRYRGDGLLRLTCWPQGTTTSDLPSGVTSLGAEEIVVTGSRIRRSGEPPPPPPPAPMMIEPPAMMATQENLGDLKLYRIPEPVTVAAMSQKQVALMDRPKVALSSVYRRRLTPVTQSDAGPVPAAHVYVTRNRAAEGLGLPLPAGRVALFMRGGGRAVLVAEGSLDDRAVGEDVEIEVGPAPGVLTQVVREAGGVDGRYSLTVTNDRPFAVAFEAEFAGAAVGSGVDAGVTLERRDGRPLWRGTVPANGSFALRYRWLP